MVHRRETSRRDGVISDERDTREVLHSERVLFRGSSWYSLFKPSTVCVWGGWASSSSSPFSGVGGSLLELEERCGHEVVLKETEEGLSVNPLSVCPTEERLGEKSASGSLPLKEGREERGVEEVGNYSVSCRFKNCEDGFCWVFSGVYGPSVKVEREEFLSELGAIRGLWNEPWYVAGDFNVIRFPSERIRGGRLSPTMRRFSEVIEELELRDLPLQGRMFTWSGGLNNLLKSRIDRFLISEDWEAHF